MISHFKDLSVRTKLALVVAVPLVALITSTIVSVMSLNSIERGVNSI